MKCPLILMAYLHRTGEVPTTQADCFKEDCAWWNKFTNECAVPMLALELNHLRAAIENMRDKMPTKDSFTR